MMFTENPYYKAIILVLSSDNTPLYRQFKQIYEKYLDFNPNIKILFVYGNEISFFPKSYDLVYDIEENYYPGMITKTIRAFEDINKLYRYDFLIRTNLSTFWDVNSVCKRLDTLPKTNCISGTFRECIYKGKKSPEYVAGVNLILSKDCVKYAIDQQEKLFSWDLPEDWAMSQIFIDANVKLIRSNPGAIHFMDKFTEFDEKKVLDEIQLAKKMHHDHFRIKNKNRDLLDIKIANFLLREYYGQTIL